MSVLSVLIACFALLLSYLANQEEAAVDFDAAASVNSLGATPAGYAIHISLVNDSLRPVIVRSMRLKVSGRFVAPIASFLSDNRAGSDASALGDEPLEEARSLPVALAARGTRTLIGLADFSTAAAQAHQGKDTPLVARAREFCRELPRTARAKRRLPEPSGRTRSKLELELDVDPGGAQTVPVHLAKVVGGANAWRMDVTGAKMHPNGIVFWRRIAAPTALRFITLKIWTWDGHLRRSASLPVAGGAYSEVRFPPLPSDSYRAALFQNGEPLAVGLFHVPLSRSNQVIFPSHAQRADGQCLRIKGKRNIYDYARTPYQLSDR
jgi:hypothetical protein